MPMKLHDVPGEHKKFVTLAPAAAATASEMHMIMIAPFNLVLTDVDAYPCAAITGHATNRFNLNLYTTEEIGNYDFTVANSASGSAACAILDSGTTEMDEGDSLSILREKVGTGLIMPPMGIEITFKAR